MFDGLEVDMLSLGDADCILISQWITYQGSNFPIRILVDGGSGDHAPQIIEFLRRRQFTDLWAVVCTHLHKDHARGLIKIVKDQNVHIQNGWMHDIRNHISADVLRRASSENSPQADAVKEIVEATKELAGAFASRNVVPQEPFAGQVISYAPSVTVLGPTRQFYRAALEEFAKIEIPMTWIYRAATAGLGGGSTRPLSDLLGALSMSTLRRLFLDLLSVCLF
jgi:metallo-beta-lactamase superfamily protein